MKYINIEGLMLEETAGKRHSFAEFEKLFPNIKDHKKAYIAIGGELPKAKKAKIED